MLFEICTGIMIFLTALICIVNPTKIMYSIYGGKRIKCVEPGHPEYEVIAKRVFFILMICAFGVIWSIIEVSYMFIVSTRVPLAKYYAIALLGIMIISMIYGNFKHKNMINMPKKESLFSVLYRNITSVITISILVLALVI